jgi:hypothetical protein
VSHLIQSKSTLSSSLTTLIVFLLRIHPLDGYTSPGNSQACGRAPRKLYCPSSWENFNREPSETSVVTWRGCRVEIDPTLHGLFNRDVDIFVVLNFRNKSYVSCAFLALHSSLHSCSCIPRVLFVYPVIYYSSLPLAFSSAPTFFLGLY